MKKQKPTSGTGIIILTSFFIIVAIVAIISAISATDSSKTETESPPAYPAYTETTTYPICFRGGVQLAERVYFFYTDTEEGLDALDEFSEYREGNIVLTLDNGKLLNEYGDGILDNGYSIRYSDIEGNPLQYPNGSRMQSVAVYNPESNIHDDVLADCHVCLDDDKRENLPSCYDDTVQDPYLQVYDDTIQDPYYEDWMDDTVIE